MIPYHIIVGDEGHAQLVFGRDSLSDLSYVESVSLDGNEIQSDEVYAVIRAPDNVNDWLALWSGVRRDTPVYVDVGDNARREKFYFKSLERLSRQDFRLIAQSPIGKLSSEFHGDLYQGERLTEVIADVLRDDNSPDDNASIVPYGCNPLLESVFVYGWLPYVKRREAIHLLALAYGFVIRRDSNGDLYFTIPPTNSYNISADEIFTGGNVDYCLGQSYSRIDVTQYSFIQTVSDKETTLFSNVDGAPPAEYQLVKFSDAPCYHIRVDGLTLHDSGVNFAIVSGVGSLYGVPYTRTESVVSVDGDPDADPDNILTINNVTLITTLNADSVGARWRDIRNAPATVNLDIIRTTQKAGDLVSFTDPYGDARTGYITALSGSVTSQDFASAEILTGYVPTWGASYDSVLVLSNNDESPWIVPDFLDGKSIRVVLIGGGSGGNSGQHGTDAKGSGGMGGLSGKGGKVYQAKLDVTAGQEIAYHCGSGGAGGIPTNETSSDPTPTMPVYVTPSGDKYHLKPHGDGNFSVITLADAIKRGLEPCNVCFDSDVAVYLSNAGDAGSATTFGDLSSDSGYSIPYGYYDVINRDYYAKSGANKGVDGGKPTDGKENGDKDNPDYKEVALSSVSLGAQTWTSGAIGEGASHKEVSPSTFTEWAFGGLGGGAAVGSDGGAGLDGVASAGAFHGGDGGKGADASAIFADGPRAYGQGGSGGHGGGEGGKGGSSRSTEGEDWTNQGRQGAGGSGSAGQDGADGCILIYFHKPDEYQYHFDIVDGHLILTYYSDNPPPYSVENGRLFYSGEDTVSIHADGHLYLD